MRRELLAFLVVASSVLGCAADVATPSGVCTGATPLTIGATANAKAGSDECAIAGGAGQIISLTLTTPMTFLVTMTPSGFVGGFTMFSGTYANVGAAKEILSVEGSSPMGARAFLPVGQYFMAAGRKGATGGAYSLTTTVTQNADCAYENWTVPGITLTGTLTTRDCPGLLGSTQQIYNVRLSAGQSVSIMASVSKNGSVIWGTSSGTIVERLLAAPTGGSASINYSATADNIYLLHFFNNQPQTGSSTFTGTIQ